MPFFHSLRRGLWQAGGQPSEGPQLFFADVADEAAGDDGALRRCLYLVLANSEAEAVLFIRRARLTACEVRPRAHNLPVATAVASYSLTYGAARMVWPREDELGKAADDYLFIDEPKSAEDAVLLGVMRGTQQSVATLQDLLAEQQVSAA